MQRAEGRIVGATASTRACAVRRRSGWLLVVAAWLLAGAAVGGVAGATVGAISEYPIPTGGGEPTEIAAGPGGSLWFTEYHGNKIARIPTADKTNEYPIPTAASGPSTIAAGPDGSLWFTEYGDRRRDRRVRRFTPKVTDALDQESNSVYTVRD